MSNGNPQAPNRGPLEVLDFPFATLFTVAPGTERERASFNWSLLNNNPRVSVWTRVPGDKNAPIQGGIGPVAMQGILDEMEECYLGGGPTEGAVTLESRPPRNEDGTSSGDFRKIVIATLKWGISSEGIRWIMIESAEEERPKIVFEFKGFEWHHFRNRQGEMAPQEASRRHAVSTIRFMRSMYAKYCKGMTPDERKAQSERFQKGKTGQGGQRSGDSYNGGGAKPRTDPMGSIVFNDEDVGF